MGQGFCGCGDENHREYSNIYQRQHSSNNNDQTTSTTQTQTAGVDPHIADDKKTPITSTVNSSQSKSNHLILHFDINKTIVMSDSVQGKALVGVINDTISECSWGVVYNINECPSDYKYNSKFIINNTIWKPSEIFGITPYKPNNDLISFMSWIKQQYPYPNGKTDQKIKQIRRSYLLNFIDLFQTNNIYTDTYNKILTKMETGAQEDDDGKPIFIVPAFWNAIHDLIAKKRSFSIVFRTFGTDIHHVMEAFNKFCVKYGYDGTKLNQNIPNLILKKRNIGAINTDIKDGKILIIGVSSRNPCDRSKDIKNQSLNEFYKLDRMKWYINQQNNNNNPNNPNIAIMRNEQHVYEYIKSKSLKNETLFFTDDYLWWSMHGENSDGGKLLILNDSDSDLNIHNIFFDDNLKFNHSGIIDVRNLNINNGKTCISDTQWNNLKNKYLLKVEPLHVMLNDNYFTQQITKIEQEFAKTNTNTTNPLL